MNSDAKTVKQYLDELPEDRLAPMEKLRNVILQNLPKGFEEVMSGMIGYIVPYSIYPAGYHCPPKQPLPFLGLASQKNFIAVYNMGMYSKPELLEWFVKEYPKHSSRRLDMGKSCIRFTKMDDIPYELIGELVSKMSVEEWIKVYEQNYLG